MPGSSEKSLQEIAYDRILRDIISCRLAPGAKLSLRDLEQELELGRTPIRESLVRLAQRGIVYTVPQSGTYVSRIDLDAAENARFIREHLEASAAGECCARATDADCAELARLIAEQERAIAATDALPFFQLDNEMHRALFRIAGRPVVWDWISQVSFDLDRYRWLSTQVTSIDQDVVIAQHRALVEAIAHRDPEEARYTASAHLHLMIAHRDAVTGAFPSYFL